MTYTTAEIVARVIHRDPDMLILDKPSGLPVHAGTKIQQHLEELLDAASFGLDEVPRLAHRLDKDTSGCLVLGCNGDALAALGRLFRLGRVEKVYWAVVAGVPRDPAGRIDLPLLKVAGATGALMVADAAGKPAVTDYRVRAASGDLAWLELRPRTGRTHQLRAHCAALGHPILGDPIYGPLRPAPCPLHLHARSLRVPLRDTEPPVAATAPLPAHMEATFAGCGFDIGGLG
jgi:tRNA pseudouridine32 synthase / 23S rRNA pseudouridine746 synthase